MSDATRQEHQHVHTCMSCGESWYCEYGDPLARRYDNAVTHTLQPSRHEETNTPVINCARHGKLPSNNGACIVCDERERIISWLQTGGGYCKDIADKLARREDICE